ncbi:MAG: hypothetical protein RL347_549 [Actinomycetota bacterium]
MIPPPMTTTRARVGKLDPGDVVMAVDAIARGPCAGLYGGSMGAVTTRETITVDAPLESVLVVIRDLPAQVDWFPGCVSSTVLETDGAGLPTRARQVNDVKVAKDEFDLDYSHTDTSMTWQLVAPSTAQKDMRGSWSLVPKGDRTDATLEISIEPALPLPGFLVKKAIGDTVKGATKGLKKYCES